MRDPLKEFVDQHRPEMDTAEPSSELWNKIETQMNFAPAIAAKTFPWLKSFFFGASAVAIAAVSYLNRPGNETSTSPNYTSVPAIQQTIASQPAVINNTVKNGPIGFPLSPISQTAPAISTSFLFPQNSDTYFGGITEAPAATDSLFKPEKNSTVIPFYKSSGTVEKTGDSLSVDTLFNGITRLEVSGGSFDVNVKAHTNESLNVKGKLTIKTKGVVTNKPHYKLTFTRQDTVLKINVECEGENGSKSYTVVGTLICNARLDIDVPEKINLIVQDRYGDASVSGLRGGICDMQLNSGDVVLKDLQTNPKLTLTYGDLTATNIKGNIFAKLSSGDFTLTDVVGNVDASSTYGDQKLSNVTGTVKLSGASGGIKMINVTGDANVKTSYGDIRLENYKGAPQFTTASGDIDGKNVELTGNTTLTTSYGDISLVLVNELDALSFDLSTSYGDIRIDKNGQKYREEKQLTLQKGNILIKAKSASGSQTYK
jgi:hypothetical protein